MKATDYDGLCTFQDDNGFSYAIPKQGDEFLADRIATALKFAIKVGEYRARSKMRRALGLEPE